MKKITLFLLVCFTPIVAIADNIKSLDVKPGLWVSSTDNSDMIEKILAKTPQKERAKLRAELEYKMSRTTKDQEHCMTEDQVGNFEKHMKDTFAQKKECDLKTIKSTSKKFTGKLICSDGSMHMDIDISAVNDKHTKSVVVMSSPKGKLVVKSDAKWKSANCSG